VGEAIEIWSPEAWGSQVTLLGNVDANSLRFVDLDL